MNHISQPQSRLQFTVHNTPATLERLLRTIRVRGFSVDDMAMKSGAQHIEIELSVSGDRSIQSLINQLNKLVDVSTIYSLDEQTHERMTA